MKLLYIILFFFFILLLPYNGRVNKGKCRNIAHACGLIDSIKYTNTLEGFFLSYTNGYRNIEIDILETRDKHIVGGHDWNRFKTLTKYSDKGDINYTFIKRAKILNKYHIIYDYMIYNLLEKYKDVNIFIDKITNYELLKKYSKITDRIYVEVFSYSQYNLSQKIGFKNIMLNIRSGNDINNILNNKYNYISAITIGPHIFYSYKIQLQKIYERNVKIYAFLIHNATHISEALCRYITGFYID